MITTAETIYALFECGKHKSGERRKLEAIYMCSFIIK